MTRKCCRTSPRCLDCPVRGLVAARKQRELGELGEPAVLVAEILAGRGPQALPASVAAAVASLELARRSGSG